jgi:geranylgeranyl diphosphate synthase type I
LDESKHWILMLGNGAKSFELETALLRQEVEAVIELADMAPPLRDGVCCQLAQKGKVFYSGGGVCWAILPLLVCEAICGKNRHAIPGAAAIEFFFAAGDAFDDVEDHETEDSLVGVYGEEKTLNIAVALLMLSQRAVTRLREQGVKLSTIISVMEAMCSGGLRGCAGQHRDLAYELEHNISPETYLEMIELKSASLVEMACQVGAILATDDPETVSSYGLFGRHLGMAAQLINDVQSIGTARWSRSDISKKKKTLPIIFAFNHADEKQRRLLDLVYDPKTVMTPELQRETAKTIIASGGVYYGLVMAEKYKQLAVKAIKPSATANSRLLALF